MDPQACYDRWIEAYWDLDKEEMCYASEDYAEWCDRTGPYGARAITPEGWIVTSLEPERFIANVAYIPTRKES